MSINVVMRDPVAIVAMVSILCTSSVFALSAICDTLKNIFKYFCIYKQVHAQIKQKDTEVSVDLSQDPREVHSDSVEE